RRIDNTLRFHVSGFESLGGITIFTDRLTLSSRSNERSQTTTFVDTVKVNPLSIKVDLLMEEVAQKERIRITLNTQKLQQIVSCIGCITHYSVLSQKVS